MDDLSRLREAVDKLTACNLHDDKWPMLHDQSCISQNFAPAGPSPPSNPSSAELPPSRPLYHQQMLDAFLKSVGNETIFLPTGLGASAVADDAMHAMIDRHPSKHVVCVVVRPAQALSLAQHIRAQLGVSAVAFCGGDLLYDFPAEFAANRVLVFTAGLLMRLAKLGTYRLDRASLIVLYDAFSAVRNHPMNTLIREYYWKAGEKAQAAEDAGATLASAPSSTASSPPSTCRPKILGIMNPQLQHSQHSPRPFDKLRQLVRKLCHGCQAGVLLPTGPALEALAARVHASHLAIHGVTQTQLEQGVLEALQVHCLLIWDTLHQFGQNHFGRLLHIPPSSAVAIKTAPGCYPSPSYVNVNGNSSSGINNINGNRTISTLPLPLRILMGPGGGTQPPQDARQHHDDEASPVDHFHAVKAPGCATPSSTTTSQVTATPPGSVVNSSFTTRKGNGSDAAFAADPAHHDWQQIETMLLHSIACSESLPLPGERRRQHQEGGTPVDASTDAAAAFESKQGEDGERHAAANAQPQRQQEEESEAHVRSETALAVMRHVLACCRAMQLGLELGLKPCMEVVQMALKDLMEFLDAAAPLKEETEEKREDDDEEQGGLANGDASSSCRDDPVAGFVDARLRQCLLSVVPASPLVGWLAACPADELEEGIGAPSSRMDALEDLLLNMQARAAECTATGKGDAHKAEQDDQAAEVESIACARRRAHKVCIVAGSEFAAAVLLKALTTPNGSQNHTVSRWQRQGRAKEIDVGVSVVQFQENSFPQGQQREEGERERSKQPQHGEAHLLDVYIMTAEEASSASAGLEALGSFAEVVWFSASDVLHAAGFEYESRALATLCRVCAAGSAGPECHILGTDAQAAAYLEICRADQLLLAAAQLVQAGDAAFEEYLTQLAMRGGSDIAERLTLPSPAAALHTLCLGLCGQPPQFQISQIIRNERALRCRATVTLPACMGHHHNGNIVTASSPLDVVFQIDAVGSEAEARDAAAETALAGLISRGLVAAYWQTRQLISVSQSCQQICERREWNHHSSAQYTNTNTNRERAVSSSPIRVRNSALDDALPSSPFIDGAVSTSQNRNASVVASMDRHICTVCGIVTTSEQHLDEHLAGRRHLSNLHRLQQQDLAMTAGADEGHGAPPPAPHPAPVHAAAAAARQSSKEEEDGNADFRPKNVPSLGFSVPQSSDTSIAEQASSSGLAKTSTIDRLPSTLSDTFLRRSASFGLHGQSSGNVYDGFPCVRVGDVILPSSMDLRAFLDEMQQAGELEPMLSAAGAESLPPIIETAAASGPFPTPSVGGYGGNNGRRTPNGGGNRRTRGGGGGGGGYNGNNATNYHNDYDNATNKYNYKNSGNHYSYGHRGVAGHPAAHGGGGANQRKGHQGGGSRWRTSLPLSDQPHCRPAPHGLQHHPFAHHQAQPMFAPIFPPSTAGMEGGYTVIDQHAYYSPVFPAPGGGMVQYIPVLIPGPTLPSTAGQQEQHGGGGFNSDVVHETGRSSADGFPRNTCYAPLLRYNDCYDTRARSSTRARDTPPSC